MFVRINRNSQGKAYLQLVRSYREGGKVRQQVLFTLGRLDVLQSTGQIDNLVAALGRYATREKLVDLSKDISIDQVYFLGAAHVVSRMMERLKLTAMFNRLRAKHPKMKLPWVGIITGMILSRFIEPCSKRRLNMEQWGRIYPGILEMEAPPLKSFYRAMDVLWKHRDDVEGALFDRGGQRDLFNRGLDVVFYDLTTLRFESTNATDGELRRFGYSKEHRSDCTQVILGLLVDRDGVPVGYELFPGNTYEPHSLPKILEKMKTKYHIETSDRGGRPRIGDAGERRGTEQERDGFHPGDEIVGDVGSRSGGGAGQNPIPSDRQRGNISDAGDDSQRRAPDFDVGEKTGGARRGATRETVGAAPGTIGTGPDNKTVCHEQGISAIFDGS
jgi:hypothetical protein